MTVLSMAVGVAVAITMTDCDVSAGSAAALCSATGRKLVPVLVLILMVGLGTPWVQYLARVMGIREEDSEFERESARSLPDSLGVAEMALPLRQHLVAGTIDSVDAGTHRITVRSLTLRFWGEGHRRPPCQPFESSAC
jgi:hypothetical protein